MWGKETQKRWLAACDEVKAAGTPGPIANRPGCSGEPQYASGRLARLLNVFVPIAALKVMRP